jgi:pimeloyl-ACP methyl ester carboxylesterase
VLAANAAHPERIPPDAALRLVRAYATAPGFEAVNDAMRASRFTSFGEITVPVILAWPEHDRIVRRPRSLPDGVRSVVLRECGHLPCWDDPEQVARVLLEGSR